MRNGPENGPKKDIIILPGQVSGSCPGYLFQIADSDIPASMKACIKTSSRLHESVIAHHIARYFLTDDMHPVSIAVSRLLSR
jgi:hypothetical protein